MILLLPLVLLLSAARSSSGQLTDSDCGTGSILDVSANQCVGASTLPEDPSVIYIGGLMDTDSYAWCPDIFEFTAQQINEGRWGALDQSQSLRLELRNSKCDETAATTEYWDLRKQNGNRPPDGVVGARCSGASTALARISGLEEVPQISPASDSAKLTSDEFPFFSRMVSPNDERGEVGALIALLRSFFWDRVTIIATDTQFAKDLVTEFRKLWVGEHQDASGSWEGTVEYSETIRIFPGGDIDRDSVSQALDATDDPTINSRIILLVAHDRHAFEVLEEAHLSNFQPDTVWVGPSAWVGREPPRKDYNLPALPGYMGVAPFRNRNEDYQSFMSAYQSWLKEQNKVVLDELPSFAAETVDAIVAMTKAISSTPVLSRSGAAIVQALRGLDINGVSGQVQFTPEGDRKNPQYTIFNAQSATSGAYIPWTDVGSLGVEIGSVALNSEEVLCFASVGCDPLNAPEDSYPVSAGEVPTWAIVLICFFALLFLLFAFKYWRSHTKKRNVKAELDAFRSSVVGMRAAECDYVPTVVRDVESGLEQSLKTSIMSSKSGSMTVPPILTVQWCWKETSHLMDNHGSDDIHGDPADCWIKYNTDRSEKLEDAFQSGKAQYMPLPGYVVKFKDMVQTKQATKFEREVKRELEASDATPKVIDLGGVQVGDTLPADLAGEPQMVLCADDIVQISTQRQDGWAFGTKLHHADEATARQLLVVATGAADGSVIDDANIFTDTGWFPMDRTRMPSAEDLEPLQKNVGDSGALDPPDNWDDIKDATVAQRHVLQEGDAERDAVVKAFMSTLRPPKFDKKVKVVKVERIQNLAMWQSYIVKRQTICYRETGHTAGDDDDEQRKALERFERSWLWHGSNAEVVDKIFQQGFNRSFCGKNATVYGKGVYFARDASYSAYPTYSVPDRNGHQYILACRVVVGEYCVGKHDALTPDIRCAKSNALHDSTVGLLGNDPMHNPSIFVTYHDAQAYPEYLITFKTK